ncbi:hypothetical protein [Streptomyces sp. NPDC005408]|uniref:hypothetical protein n=1 Tax=Streptomyces sp. NPDC005408 TaxID=3155341 RepID=UPI0033A1F6CB
MTKTRRVLAAVALATGATALAAPAASADVAPDHKIAATSVIDGLAASNIPAEHRAEVPPASGQLRGLGGGINELNKLHQLTDLVAPVTGLLPAVQ